MSKVEQMKMTKVQHRAVKDLAVRMCANYDRPTGDCLLMDEACWQVCCSSGLCRYFKEAVLPLDRVFYADLVKPGSLKVCACGRSFVPASNRAKYCPECAKVKQREAATLRKRKQRLNAG